VIVEDLLWKDSITPCGLSRSFQGLLMGEPVLWEAELCEIRFLGVLGTVGMIFDLRPGFYGMSEEDAPADVAVLVVRGVKYCNSPGIRDALVLWETQSTDRSWRCRIGLVHTPGQTVISGTGASVYGGLIPGFPGRQPDLGRDDPATIRAGWPTWQSEFVMTVEPEHVNPEMVKDYVHWERYPGTTIVRRESDASHKTIMKWIGEGSS